MSDVTNITAIRVKVTEDILLQIGSWRDVWSRGSSYGTAALRLIEIGLASENERIEKLRQAGEARSIERRIQKETGS